jgi:HAD superfamily hydrolase (TIGR01490 family)
MNLALFDFDHTITSADTYSRFLYSIARPGEARRGKLMLAPWLIGYRIGMVSAMALRARATRFAFRGRSRHEIAGCGERYAREILPGLLRPEMMRRIAWHQDRGDRIVIVSGSLDSYLQPWCSQHGLELICNALDWEDDRLTGRYHPVDRASAKAMHIRAQYDLAAYPEIYAYGDSSEDREMLALARHRWFRGRQL